MLHNSIRTKKPIKKTSKIKISEQSIFQRKRQRAYKHTKKYLTSLAIGGMSYHSHPSGQLKLKRLTIIKLVWNNQTLLYAQWVSKTAQPLQKKFCNFFKF